MKNVAPSDCLPTANCWSIAHFPKAMSLWNFCVCRLDLSFLCRSLRHNSCQTKYLPALTTHVRFHNLPPIFNTPCARVYCFDYGQSCNVSRMACNLSLVIEIRIACVLMVKPSAATIEFQSVLSFGANLWALCISLLIQTVT